MRNKQVGSQGEWETERKRQDGQESKELLKDETVVKFHIEKILGSKKKTYIRTFLLFETQPLRSPSASTIKDLSLPLSIETKALAAK